MSGPVVRLHLYFARETPRAVILRQGPVRQFRMILWHTDTDRFEDGQWVKQNVYTERCAISPDGRHFIYFMLDGKWHTQAEGAYTAISRPPHFTALALFPEGSTWGGGGTFIDDRHFVATGGEDIIGQARGLERLRRVAPTPENATGLVRADGSRAALAPEVRRRLLEGDGWRPPLDRYDTQGGCLYRRRGGDMEMIRDFTAMRFERVTPP